MTDLALLRRTIELSIESVAEHGGPFGALVVRDGRILGEGRNRVVPDADPTAHAEVLALRAAARALGTHDLSGCEIYASCEPCPMCLGAIHWARIRVVHYAAGRDDAAAAGFDDARLYAAFAEAGAGDVETRTALREEALEAFRVWGRTEGRVPY